MNQPESHIVFAGGGTAGHLFPGLAVAEKLVTGAENVRITFVGPDRDFEQQIVERADFDYVGIHCRPLSRRPDRALRFVADNVKGYRAARRFVQEQDVSLVVGLGGYASVPMARAGLSRGLPLVLLEQNALPGRATRWLAPSAALVCVAFDQARPRLRARRVEVTGNPVRQEIAELFGSTISPQRSPKHLLILGGSGGAQALNQHLPPVLAGLKERLAGWRIIHQTGQRDAEATAAMYANYGLEAQVSPFISNMAEVVSRADLAVCRAGGTTLAELSLAGVPAVVIPHSEAAENHQWKNARAAAGGHILVDETREDFRWRLSAELGDLLLDSARREALGREAKHRAAPQAAWHVAALIADLLRTKQVRRSA